MIDKIVLNIPHSSEIMPECTWDGNIKEKIDKWTDLYTDELFYNAHDDRVKPIIFPYSRFYCDAERLIEDPLEEKGQGIFYTQFDECKRNKDEDEVKRVYNLYNIHQEKLKNAIEDENTLVIDCHSFPKDLSDIDICIGWNDDWSKPDDWIINLIMEHFQDYKVGLNNPYSNSISPKKDFNYQSVMIEINKKWYLDKNGEKTSDFYKKVAFIQYLYKKILDYDKRR